MSDGKFFRGSFVKRLLLFLFGSVLAAGVPVLAHHSFAKDYLEEQMVSMEGELLEFQHKNPHSTLLFAAADDGGQMQRFMGEWGGISRLTRDGITKDTFKPGDFLILSGSPGRRPEERRLHVKGIHRPADGWKWGRAP